VLDLLESAAPVIAARLARLLEPGPGGQDRGGSGRVGPGRVGPGRVAPAPAGPDPGRPGAPA
jgi:hypothetical protein